MFQTLRMDPPVLLQSMAIQANDIKQVIYNRQGSSIEHVVWSYWAVYKAVRGPQSIAQSKKLQNTIFL